MSMARCYLLAATSQGKTYIDKAFPTLFIILLCLSIFIRGHEASLTHHTTAFTKRDVTTVAGNPDVAGDLYGLGVRLGIYLQSAGLLIGSMRPGATAAGPAALANNIGILVSWNIVAVRRAFSASEAYVVLMLASISGLALGLAKLPARETRLDVATRGLMWVVSGWAYALSIWFWAVLVRELPRYDTSNEMWFWARVRLDHWIRVFSLVMLALGPLWLLWERVFILLYRTFADADGGKKTDFKIPKWLLASQGIGLSLSFAFLVTTAEMTIKYNKLQPRSSVSSPSQSTPFVIGTIVLVMSFFEIFQKEDQGEAGKHKYERVENQSDHRGTTPSRGPPLLSQV